MRFRFGVNQELQLQATGTVTDLMRTQCGWARFTGALNVGGGIVDSPDQVP